MKKESAFLSPSVYNNSPLKQEISLLGAGGENPITSNFLQNGNMEEQASNGGPVGYSYWGSTYIVVNSTYQTEVHSGSYASYIGGKGTLQTDSYAQNYRYLTDIPQVILDLVLHTLSLFFLLLLYLYVYQD